MKFPARCSRNSNILYELLTLGDVEEVSLFCQQHFFPKEPLCSLYQYRLSPEEAASLTQFVRYCIRKGTCYKAVDVSQEHRLVAVKIAHVIRKDEQLGEESSPEENGTSELKIDPKVMDFLGVLKKSCDYFSTFAVQSYFMHEMTAVLEDYGGRGICSELLRLSEEHVRATHNIKVFVVTATNVRTQKAYLKAGYQILRRLDFGTFSDVPVHEERTDTGCLQVKRIS